MAKKAKIKQRWTPSMQRQAAENLVNGRKGKQAYTSGAREVRTMTDARGYNVKQKQGMIDAWNNGTRVQTYTSSARGRLSTNGQTAGGSTWTMTAKDADGNKISQSGRNKIATRRQRYYDVRVGLGLSGG